MYMLNKNTEAKATSLTLVAYLGIKIFFLTIITMLALMAYSSAQAETSMAPQSKRHSNNTNTAQAEAFFAGGCFWGVEDAFSKVEGVLDVISGYMGGTTPSPTYRDVSSSKTGHAETVRVVYDPKKVSYETLARLFFEIHDPTQLNQQGPDVGTQYRSAIFYTNDDQMNTATMLMDQLRGHGWDVVTTLEPAGAFTPAEAEHQNFTARTGRGGCHVRVDRFSINM